MVDRQASPIFPDEGRVSVEIITNIERPMTDKDFLLGLETNFDQMKRYIDERRQLVPDYNFIDPKFPPDSNALVKTVDSGRIYWKRAKEMSRNPKLVVSGTSKHDVIQGHVGDCYFLSACAGIASRSDIMNKVMPKGQVLYPGDKTGAYNGLLRFRFWRFGKWIEVIVDDHLPTSTGFSQLYAKSASPHEFWISFVEKAYAKIHGSYDAIVGGFSANAMEDLTGGLSTEFDMQKLTPKKKTKLFRRIKMSVRHDSIVCCSVDLGTSHVSADGIDRSTGLVVEHAYTVTAVEKVKLKNKTTENLLRIRNPWGDETEWTGRWSDRSSWWSEIKRGTQTRLKRKIEDDGEWWMSYDDFCRHFHHVSICTLAPDFNEDGISFEKRWHLSTVNGSWKKGIDAGGSTNDIFKYARNPQFHLQLSDPDEFHPKVDDNEEMGKCSIQIGLMQEHRKLDKLAELPMYGLGLKIYKVNNTPARKLNVRYLRNRDNAVKSSKIYKQQREISIHTSLLPGHYVIIPSTFYSNDETTYLLRIFTEKKIKLNELRG